MHRLEVSLKLAALSLFLAACSRTSPTILPPATPSPAASPSPGNFVFRFEPPLAIGPGTPYLFGRDLRLTVTFGSPVEFDSIPSPITLAGIEFSKSLPNARQLVSSVEFSPTNPALVLPSAIIK